MKTKNYVELLGKKFDKIVLSVERTTQLLQAELYLQGEKIGEVKPEVPAGNYTFYGWQVWNLVKPMIEARNKLCVVLLYDKFSQGEIFELNQQLCKKFGIEGVKFGQVLTPDRLEINCA